MNLGPLFSKEELEDAAFYLLTCSSAERYARMAKDLAVRSKLSSDLKTNPDLTKGALRRARDLWKEILSNKQRDIPELELAVLLPLLAQTASSEVDDLLLALGLVDRPNAAWIGVLARRLRIERASNLDLAQSFRMPTKGIPNHSFARSNYAFLIRPTLGINSPRTKASQKDEAFPLAVA